MYAIVACAVTEQSNVSADFSSSDMACSCAIPCEETSYEKSLSYAQLARNNVERLALTTQGKLETARQNLEQALEVRERFDVEIHLW